MNDSMEQPPVNNPQEQPKGARVYESPPKGARVYDHIRRNLLEGVALTDEQEYSELIRFQAQMEGRRYMNQERKPVNPEQMDTLVADLIQRQDWGAVAEVLRLNEDNSALMVRALNVQLPRRLYQWDEGAEGAVRELVDPLIAHLDVRIPEKGLQLCSEEFDLMLTLLNAASANGVIEANREQFNQQAAQFTEAVAKARPYLSGVRGANRDPREFYMHPVVQSITGIWQHFYPGAEVGGAQPPAVFGEVLSKMYYNKYVMMAYEDDYGALEMRKLARANNIELPH